MAYPTVRESSTNPLILTKGDFDGPGDKLLEKLGLNFSEPATMSSVEIQMIKNLFLKLVARYIGLLSCVPLKNCSEALKYGQGRIELEIKKVDNAFKVSVEDNMMMEHDQEDEEETDTSSQRNNRNFKEILKQDELSMNIKDAIEKRNYREGPFRKKRKGIFSFIEWNNLKLANKVNNHNIYLLL